MTENELVRIFKLFGTSKTVDNGFSKTFVLPTSNLIMEQMGHDCDSSDSKQILPMYYFADVSSGKWSKWGQFVKDLTFDIYGINKYLNIINSPLFKELNK